MNSLAKIASLDAQIATAEHVIRQDSNKERQSGLIALKKERNALTPFCAAPAEIVGRILVELNVIPACPTSFFEADIARPDSKWTVVMLLCSRIRAVALHTPELWSFVEGTAHPSWIELSMQRASNHPLTVMALDDKHDGKKEITPALVRAASLVEIYVGNDLEQAQQYWEGAFATSITQLRALKAKGFWELSTRFMDRSSDHLIELSLTEVHLSPPPLLPRLQRLRLDNIRCPYDDYSIMLAFFASSPSLEVLEILNSCAKDHYDHSHWADVLRGSPTISMPHLKVLCLEENASTTQLLLEAIPTPSQTLAVLCGRWRWNSVQFPLKTSTPTPVGHGYEDLSHILHHVKDFWYAKSGHGFLPAGFISLANNTTKMIPIHIRFGARPNIATPTPFVCYESECTLEGPDPLLDVIDTLHILLRENLYADQTPDAETNLSLANALESMDRANITINHVVVGYMEVCTGLRTFEKWLRKRRDMTKNSSGIYGLTMDYEGPRSGDAEAWTKHLLEEGLVKRITWSWKAMLK
jgi:hypothetical protein